jgi:hypothetical protein
MGTIDEITNDNMCNADDPNAELGIKNSVLYDPTSRFVYNKTDSEDIWVGQNNTSIVLGRDRPAGMDSGYGGMGHLRAGAIDIVAGRLSGLDARNINGPVNPNFGADAARIYISQKTDIDANFSIPEGLLRPSEAQSAIGIKADAIRIIGRESLKLVTNTDSKLSNGNEAFIGAGVQLIAKSTDDVTLQDMQPIPKGDNLVQAFDELVSYIEELNGIVMNFYLNQKRFNEALSEHTHYENFQALEASFNPEVLIEHMSISLQNLPNTEQALKSNSNNYVAWKSKYTLSSGTKYVNSSYHFLN